MLCEKISDNNQPYGGCGNPQAQFQYQSAQRRADAVQFFSAKQLMAQAQAGVEFAVLRFPRQFQFVNSRHIVFPFPGRTLAATCCIMVSLIRLILVATFVAEMPRTSEIS